MRRFMLAGALTIAASLFGVVGAGHADVGPSPVYSEGGILRPAGVTDIVMKSEKVTLTYSSPTTNKGEAVMKAHVVAQFKMNNPAASAKTMNVYFPSDDGQYAQGVGGADITNFTVDGKKLSSALVDVSAGYHTGSDPKSTEVTIRAYQWSQTFAAGESTVTVEYDTMAGKAYGMYDLTYVLGTGRNWSGVIGSGEVDFVLPGDLPAYAVTGKAPMVKQNKLQFTVSGKTIKVAFTNYEPAADDVIVLGVGDPTVVANIEKLKQTKPQTLDTTLQIANNLRVLSSGAHCMLCTAPPSTEAETYYDKALDLSTTKDQLDSVLRAYAFGGSPAADDTLAKLFDWFAYFTPHHFCMDSDAACGEKQYMLDQTTPFSTPYGSSALTHTDFLALYACRVRPFDANGASLVENFIIKRLESCPVAQTKAPQATASGSSTGATKPAAKTDWALVGIIAAATTGVVIVTLGIFVGARRYRNRKHKPVSHKGSDK
jgi:hypothetical protein